MVSKADSRRKRAAPYVPASTLSAFFDHIRYVRTPPEVDSGLLQDYGISPSNSFALLSTLKYLGIIDDKGAPTPAFKELQTGGDEFSDALRRVLEHAYDDLFSRLDVSRDTKDKIVNFFARNYSPATAERATRLFLDLCGEAGIETASQPRKSDAAREKVKARSATKRQGSVQGSGQENDGNGADDPEPSTPQVRNAGAPNIDIRINSQDLIQMDKDQIAAIFEGLAKLAPKPTVTEENGGTGNA